MKDYYFIFHNFGSKRAFQVQRFLKENDLLKIADFSLNGITPGLCSIRLPANDHRINLFIEEIKKHEGEPFIRFDREYSPNELDEYLYLLLVIKTANLPNLGPNQKYDYSNACPNCGAGILPVLPLHIPVNKMGKKLIDITAHNGWPIFRNNLKKILIDNHVTGITFKNITLGKDVKNFSMGLINSILPRFHPSSKISFNHSRCNICNNSGNFPNFSSETTYIYKKRDLHSINDFNLTHEFFGEWEPSKFGGSRFIVISQRVRQIFLKTNVRFISYLPVELIK